MRLKGGRGRFSSARPSAAAGCYPLIQKQRERKAEKPEKPPKEPVAGKGTGDS